MRFIRNYSIINRWKLQNNITIRRNASDHTKKVNQKVRILFGTACGFLLVLGIFGIGYAIKAHQLQNFAIFNCIFLSVTRQKKVPDNDMLVFNIKRIATIKMPLMFTNEFYLHWWVEVRIVSSVIIKYVLLS